MQPDRVSNLGPLALESDELLTVPRGPATLLMHFYLQMILRKIDK